MTVHTNRMFDTHNATVTPRHAEIYSRYEKAYNLVDFVAALTFVVGSVLFFFETQQIPATWAFLVGSICFALRPTVTVLREFHLARVPVPGLPDQDCDSTGREHTVTTPSQN